MVRNLTTLVLGGLLASVAFAGNAQACHKMGCGKKACVVAAPCPPPVVCAPKVKKTCMPKIKTCGFHMPKFCHKKACAPTVMACATPVGYAMPSPQASPQH